MNVGCAAGAVFSSPHQLAALFRVEEEVVSLVTSEQGDTRSRAQGVASYLQRYQHRTRELGPRHQVTPASSVQHFELNTVFVLKIYFHFLSWNWMMNNTPRP